jgi:hypothetical protein
MQPRGRTLSSVVANAAGFANSGAKGDEIQAVTGHLAPPLRIQRK